MKIKQN